MSTTLPRLVAVVISASLQVIVRAGNLAAVVAKLCRLEKTIKGQVLFYPIADYDTETASYQQFDTNKKDRKKHICPSHTECHRGGPTRDASYHSDHGRGNDIVATRYWGTTHSTFRGPRWSPSADTIIEQTHQWLKKCV